VEEETIMKRCLTILSLVGTVGALTAFAPAGQAAATVSKFPVSFTLFDPCTNENVDFTGSGVVVLTTQDNHAVFHSTDVNITGIGETTGASYRELNTVTIAEQGNDQTGPYAETNPVHFSMITPGGGNNLEVDAIFHITITATGDVSVFLNRFTATCG
jgi:hypothetical protein